MTCSSPKRTNWNALLSRVDILPTHFVATQAATESGWGTSKLAQSNNNLLVCVADGAVVPKPDRFRATTRTALLRIVSLLT